MRQVHYDDPPHYYTILLDGQERSTVRNKLMAYEEGGPDAPGSCAPHQAVAPPLPTAHIAPATDATSPSYYHNYSQLHDDRSVSYVRRQFGADRQRHVACHEVLLECALFLDLAGASEAFPSGMQFDERHRTYATQFAPDQPYLLLRPASAPHSTTAAPKCWQVHDHEGRHRTAWIRTMLRYDSLVVLTGWTCETSAAPANGPRVGDLLLAQGGRARARLEPRVHHDGFRAVRCDDAPAPPASSNPLHPDADQSIVRADVRGALWQLHHQSSTYVSNSCYTDTSLEFVFTLLVWSEGSSAGAGSNIAPPPATSVDVLLRADADDTRQLWKTPNLGSAYTSWVLARDALYYAADDAHVPTERLRRSLNAARTDVRREFARYTCRGADVAAYKRAVTSQMSSPYNALSLVQLLLGDARTRTSFVRIAMHGRCPSCNRDPPPPMDAAIQHAPITHVVSAPDTAAADGNPFAAFAPRLVQSPVSRTCAKCGTRFSLSHVHTAARTPPPALVLLELEEDGHAWRAAHYQLHARSVHQLPGGAGYRLIAALYYNGLHYVLVALDARTREWLLYDGQSTQGVAVRTHPPHGPFTHPLTRSTYWPVLVAYRQCG